MRKRLFWWTLAGFLWTAAAGTLLHFVYDRSGGSPLIAAFSAVSESMWEHMKLLFVPMFLFTVVQIGFLGKTYPNLLAVRAVSILTGLALIPVLFYTYSGAVGNGVTAVNVAIFYAAALAAFVLDARLLRRGRFSAPWQQVLGWIAVWALAFFFVWCTFRAPQLGLWRDPVTLWYGI